MLIILVLEQYLILLQKKNVTKAQGVELIKNIKKVVNIPIVAIGGINMSNFSDVIEAGADGFCSISDIVKHEDMKTRILKIKEFQATFSNIKGKNS